MANKIKKTKLSFWEKQTSTKEGRRRLYKYFYVGLVLFNVLIFLACFAIIVFILLKIR